jgi:hypothetical protein
MKRLQKAAAAAARKERNLIDVLVAVRVDVKCEPW